MSTAHEEHEAFALLDEAVDAMFGATRDKDSDPNDVALDAVLIIGVQRADVDGARVEVFPRPGTQPAATRTLISEAGKLLDQATNGDAANRQPTTPGGVTPTLHRTAPPMA